MSEQGWQVVSNKKVKKDKSQIPSSILNDPIISRQRDALARIELEKNEKKQIRYDGPKDTNQDWNYVNIGKPKPKPKVSLPQRPQTVLKEMEEGDVGKIKKVSKSMAKAIVDARVSKQWNQQQLAQNSAIDLKTIGEIERAGCVYDANIFNKLCKTLGVKIERNYDLV